MGGPQLLREWIGLSYTTDLIKESREKNGGKILLQGIIQKADTPNQNKRKYPLDVLKREVENYQKAVRESRAVGELDHPESSTVSLTNASHVVKDMWWDGNSVCGKIEVLNTPRGQILQSLLDSGVMIGISSRGVGSTEQCEGLDIVQPDFALVAFDIVSEPSTPGAYLQMTEGKELKIGLPIYSKADRIFRALNDIVRK